MLFGPTLFSFIESVGRTGLELRSIQRQLKHFHSANAIRVTGTGQSEMDARRSQELLMIPILEDQLLLVESRVISLHEVEAKRLFLPYLQLHQDRSWFARLSSRINRWVNQDVPAKLNHRYERETN
jgi:hypothetical protein